MPVDDNLLAGVRTQIKPDLACSTDSLRKLLGYPDTPLYKNPLPEEKYYNNVFSYSRTQLGILINTRNLTLSISYYNGKHPKTTLLTAWNVTFPHHKMGQMHMRSPTVHLSPRLKDQI